MGIRSNYDNLLVSKELLKEKDVELYQTDRGGDITYHGPGQIIGYFIVKLKKLNLRLSDYMHNLEKVVIDTLSSYDLKAYQREDYPGVWVDNTKICAIGVRAKKYITYHGLAFNVNTDKSFFNLIDIEKVKDKLIKSYENIFDIKLDEISLEKMLGI
jgi:lipoyl(octanoyl) transferase